MADRPIIFSAPMVRALLDGRKTQTRRVLKPQPNWVNGDVMFWKSKVGLLHTHRLPYAPGDRLWVREAWAKDGDCPLQYKAGPHIADDAIGVRWRSSIHMPRWASRIALTVTDVRVQRLQKISAADAIAEGIAPAANSMTIDCDTPNPRDSFASLWNSIHGPGAWDANPWVCALTFTVRKGNIDHD